MHCLRVLALMALVAVTGCESPPPQTGQARADAATRAACRQRANEVYDRQNRGTIYSTQSQVNTPFSGSYTFGTQDRGLSQLFAHDQMINDCVRNTGTGTERTTPPAAADAAPPAAADAAPPAAADAPPPPKP